MPRRGFIGGRWLGAALGILVASSGAQGQGTPERDREKPPVGGRPRDFSLPAKETFRLDNGLQVTLVPYGAVPKVLVQLTVRTGNIDEGPDQVWLADLTGDLMKEGTATRSADQVARAAAGMGGAIRVGVGEDRTWVSGEVLSDFAPEIVRLIADVVRHPALPESELARLKGDRVRQLSVARQQPRSITLAEFRRRMYPDHPYGRLFPTEAMLRGYTIDQVREFWASHFGAARSHLYVSGRFDAEALRSAVAEAFGDWPAGPPARTRLPRPVARRAIYLIDRPGAPQSTVYLGLPVVDPSDPDWVPLQVANSLLGGSFGSRITRNIRENKGYTYSPFSQVSTRYRDAYWVEVADVTTAATGPAIREILKEVERLRAEPPPADELRGIQNYMAGIFVLQNSNRAGIIGQLSFLDLHGLTDEYLTGYVNRVYSVTPSDVQRIADDYLRSENMLLVVTGDRAKIASQLRRFGSVVEVRPGR